jgi:hypothetical protein
VDKGKNMFVNSACRGEQSDCSAENTEDEQTHTFIDEAQGNNKACCSTIYKDTMGDDGYTHHVRFLEPEGQEQMNRFVKGIQKDPEKVGQGNNKEHHATEYGETTGHRDTC